MDEKSLTPPFFLLTHLDKIVISFVIPGSCLRVVSMSHTWPHVTYNRGKNYGIFH